MRWYSLSTYLDKKINMEVTAKQEEMKPRKEELQIRQDEIQSEWMWIEQAEQQTRFKMEEERRKEESLERREMFERQGKVADAMSNLMAKFSSK